LNTFVSVFTAFVLRQTNRNYSSLCFHSTTPVLLIKLNLTESNITFQLLELSSVHQEYIIYKATCDNTCQASDLKSGFKWSSILKAERYLRKTEEILNQQQ
jgi:hypothetical protein